MATAVQHDTYDETNSDSISRPLVPRSTSHSSASLVAARTAGAMTGRRSWLTDLLLAALGASSWLAINGVWAELPLLVAALPEAWTLPSHLAVVIQLANAGPLLYAFVLYLYGGWLADGGRRRARLRRLETVTIVLMLAVSAAACFLAAGLWRRTVPLHALTPHVGAVTATGSSSSSDATGGATAGGGKAGERSVALLSLVFCIALVDCTSSVVYVPFTARFQARYMLAYMAGEGLSGLLPSLAALAQGVGGNTACVNISSYGAAEPYTSAVKVTSLPAAAALAQVELGQQLGNYTVVPSQPPSLLEATQLVPAAVAPRFSVGVFFCLLGAMTLASLAAFALLLLLPALQSSREPPPAPVLSSRSSTPRLPSAVRWSEALSISAAAAATSSTTASVTRPASSSTSTTATHPPCSAVSSVPPSATAALISAVSSRRIYLQLLLVQAVLCAVSNGLLPSLQTYSILPYGNMAFHLVASLGLAANPLACLALAWRPCRRLAPVALSALTSLLLASYLLYTAVQSPRPPLQHSAIGCVIIVAVWLLYIGLCTYAKVSIAGLLRPHGHRPLFWYGVNTQAGSLAGAVAGYIAVNVYHAFDIYQPC